MYVMVHGDAKGMVGLKDAMGIDKTAIMSWNGPVASDLIGGNAAVTNAITQFPDRFLGVASVNPSHFSEEELMASVRECVEEKGFVGLKPYLLEPGSLYRERLPGSDDSREKRECSCPGRE